MLSRRSVRIKVMQLLYAMASDEVLTYKDVSKIYLKTVENSYDVFLFNFFNFVQVAKVASDDEEKRKAKHLPTDLDKLFSAALAENELISSVRDSAKLNKIFEKKGFPGMGDKDIYRKVYNEFAKKEEYLIYLRAESKTAENHKQILLDLYRFCRSNELFVELMEDNYINWIDDKSLVVGTMKKVIKMLPLNKDEDLRLFYPDEETANEYGEKLLETTVKGDEVLMEYITPLLKNWDEDRLAVVDTVILKMAASEFLNFETIPTKVTLNEYVEVSKAYSTDKSKEFINGVLDRLMKKLEKDGKIQKAGRGLVD